MPHLRKLAQKFLPAPLLAIATALDQAGGTAQEHPVLCPEYTDVLRYFVTDLTEIQC